MPHAAGPVCFIAQLDLVGHGPFGQIFLCEKHQAHSTGTGRDQSKIGGTLSQHGRVQRKHWKSSGRDLGTKHARGGLKVTWSGGQTSV